MNTLITDGFEDETPETETVEPYEPHNILYGPGGWTDGLDDEAIELLRKTGAIRLDRTITGVGFETRIFVSVAGIGPK